VQLKLQSKFASTLHSPSQLASHFASHEALGGVASQLTLHSPSQLDEHDASQSARAPASLPAFASHLASHFPVQLALQLPSQSRLPALPVHSPSQSAWHWPVHDACTPPVHRPEHSASKRTGSQ
jgi:hypothetical protein